MNHIKSNLRVKCDKHPANYGSLFYDSEVISILSVFIKTIVYVMEEDYKVKLFMVSNLAKILINNFS